MKKKIAFLLTFTVFLFFLGILVQPTNKPNFITALVIQDINFDKYETYSTPLQKGDTSSLVYNGNYYSFKVLNIKEGSIELSLDSNTFEIKLKESRNIDLDKDSISDISIYLNEIDNGAGTTSFSRISCIPEWFCSYYGDCINNQQNRTCEDLKKCSNPSYVPRLSKSCIETCSDGVKNQDETGLDCGGSCRPCNANNDYSILLWAAVPIVFALISIIITLFLVKIKKKPKQKKPININNQQISHLDNIEDNDSFYETLKESNIKKQNPNELEIIPNKEEPKEDSFYDSIYEDKSTTEKITAKETIANETQEDIDPKIQQLRDFIQESLNKGYTLTQIKSKLISLGWKEEIVDQNIIYVKLKKK